jgi:hypothetical protein
MTIRNPDPSANGSAQVAPRIQRPVPERFGPLRSPAHAFRSAKPNTNGHAAKESTKSVVASAVESAYRVYDEYLKLGYEAAAQRYGARDRRAPMDPKPYDRSASATQWMDLWQDMYRQWLSAVAPFMGISPASARGGPFDPGSPWPSMPWMPQQPAGGNEVELEIDAAQRVRVSLHLVRKSPGPLRVTLQREAGEGQLVFEFESTNIRLQLDTVHAPGTYGGIVRDARGDQVGMLTIQLFAAP